MFVRFTGREVDPSSNVEKGIFKLAYELKEDNSLTGLELSYLNDLVDWFKDHLPVPTNFGSMINKDPDTNNGICWFRDSSKEVFAKVWELKYFLENQGCVIDILRTEAVGKIIYSDEHQIVAEPKIQIYKKLKRH